MSQTQSLEPREVSVKGSGKLSNGYSYEWSVVLEPSIEAKKSIEKILGQLRDEAKKLYQNVKTLSDWLKAIKVYRLTRGAENKLRIEKVYGESSNTILESGVKRLIEAAKELEKLDPGSLSGTPLHVAEKVVGELKRFESQMNWFGTNFVKLYDLGEKGIFYRFGNTHSYLLADPEALTGLMDRYNKLRNYGVIAVIVKPTREEVVADTYSVTGVKRGTLYTANEGAAQQIGVDIDKLIEAYKNLNPKFWSLAKIDHDYLTPIIVLMDSELKPLASLLAQISKSKIMEAMLEYNALTVKPLQGAPLCKVYSSCENVKKSLGFEPYIIFVVDNEWLKSIHDKLSEVSSLMRITPLVVYTPSSELPKEAIKDIAKAIVKETGGIIAEHELEKLISDVVSGETWIGELLKIIYNPSKVRLKADNSEINLDSDNVRQVLKDPRVVGTEAEKKLEQIIETISTLAEKTARKIANIMYNVIVAYVAYASIARFVDRIRKKLENGEELSPSEKQILSILHNCSTKIGLVQSDSYDLCIIYCNDNDNCIFTSACRTRDSLELILKNLKNNVKVLVNGVKTQVKVNDAYLNFVEKLGVDVNVPSIKEFDNLVYKLIESFEDVCRMLNKRKGKEKSWKQKENLNKKKSKKSKEDVKSKSKHEMLSMNASEKQGKESAESPSEDSMNGGKSWWNLINARLLVEVCNGGRCYRIVERF